MAIILRPESPASPASLLRGEGKGIVAQPLGEFRIAANRQDTGTVKTAILRIQRAINGMDFTKVKDDEERMANETALEALLRRRAILEAILAARGKLKQEDAQDMAKWIEKETKVKRAF